MRTRQLSDNLVLLRPYSIDDADALCKSARESLGEEWLAWRRSDYSRDDAANWIYAQVENWKRKLEYTFGVFERETGRFVGGCGLNQVDLSNRRANLGYWVRTSAKGRGFATAAARLVARFGFEQLQLERIEIVAAVGNVASQCVATKIGAAREAIARRRLRVNGVQHDAVIFSLVWNGAG